MAGTTAARDGARRGAMAVSRKGWVLVAVGAMLMGAPGMPSWAATAPDTFQATPGQWAALKIGPVRLEPFQAHIDTDGQVAFNDDATTPVYSPYSGRVVRVMVRAGDRVAKGQPLMLVDAAEAVQARDDLASAVAGLAAARAQVTLASATERRQHALVDAEGAAIKDWQQAQSDLATAQANLRTAEATLEAVRGRLRILGRTPVEIAALERRMAAGGAPADDSGAVPVLAPIAGVVTQRQVGLGQYVSSAATGGAVLFTIADTASVWLVANVREEDAPAMAPGDPVAATVLAYPGRVFKGRLDYVAAAIDPTTHRLPVHAVLDNADGALKPQMYATLSVLKGAPVPAPAVPDTAIVYEGDQARVWVAHPADKTIGLRQVTVGSRGPDGLMEITSGLKAGESVVLQGALFIDRAVKGD